METRYFEFGPFRLDSKTKVVLRHGKAVSLNIQAIEVLITLVGRRGAAVGTDELLRNISGPSADDTNLVQNIALLRNILAENPEHSPYIEESPTDGYRFIGPVRDVAIEDGRIWRAWWGLAGAVIVMIAVAVTWFVSRPSAHSTLLTPVPLTSFGGVVGEPTFSPEGDRVAFVWDGATRDNFDIYVKLVGPGPPLRLTTSPAIDFTPVWSPDGKTIGFQRFENGILDILLVPALGGPERKIGQLYSARYSGEVQSSQLCWSHDGTFLIASGKASPAEPTSLFAFSVADGSSVKITSPERGNLGDFGPSFSPDGRHLAFCRVTHVGAAEIYVGSMGPDMKIDSAPKPITFDRQEAGSRVWTPDGKEIVFVSTRLGSRTTLWRVPVKSLGADPEPVRLEAVGERVSFPAISARAHRLAFIHQNFNTNIWKLPLGANGGRGGAPSMLIGSQRNEYDPDYSEDGTKVVFLSDRTGNKEVWSSDASGSNLVQLTDFKTSAAGCPRWAPDGNKIVFHARIEGKTKICVMNVSGGRMDCLTSGQSEDSFPSWSHDGHWIFYASNRGGDMQVWKMRSDGSDAKQITRQGGFFALESKDGKTLYYAKYARPIRIMNTPLWKVPVNGGEETQVLESGPAFSRNFALTLDGIYLMPISNDAKKSVLRFFRFSDGSIQDVIHLPHSVHRGMALAPDGRALLYTQVDQQDGEVMLVENFR